MIYAVLNYSFMQNAVIASVLAAVVCGIIGVIVVEKKLIMMSGGIAHTAYGGVGLGYLLGFEPIFGALGFSVLAALGIGTIRRKGGAGIDVAVAIFWSLGMAMGIGFAGMAPGYMPDMTSYLFGNINYVTSGDVTMMLVLTVVVTAVVFIFFNDWKRYLFDSQFAGVRGMKTALFEYLLLVLVALSVVVLIRVAGIILVIALLAVPAATAALFTADLRSRIFAAVGVGLVNVLGGLTVAFYTDIPAGATTVILSALLYFVAFILKKIVVKKP